MHKIRWLLIVLLVYACATEKKEVALYNNHCASCHIAPNIQDLPKSIWQNTILPEMGARMGIREEGFDPMQDLNFTEQAEILKLGIYPDMPIIKQEDWELLKNHILAMAPDSLPSNNEIFPFLASKPFHVKSMALDGREGSFFTHLNFDKASGELLLGDIQGSLLEYDFKNDTVVPMGRFGSALVDFDRAGSISFATTIGSLQPTELSTGAIYQIMGKESKRLPFSFHRPTNLVAEDLNGDGTTELVLTEYGNLMGTLTLLSTKSDGSFERKTLLNQSGSFKTVVKDMNKDGRLDLIVGTAQGDEGITILYQEDNLSFRPEKVLRFSPVYGTSWFELYDYDGDGDDDIITVHGDNADESYVSKPYHGLRLHINNGENEFEEKYFYALNGATRVVVNDFDQDGDTDFGLLSTFPDYEKEGLSAFVYLENNDTDKFDFRALKFKDSNRARWFLMTDGDIDNDGDIDIVLSALSIAFAPVPDELSEFWKEQMIDLLVLENQTNPNIP